MRTKLIILLSGLALLLGACQSAPGTGVPATGAPGTNAPPATQAETNPTATPGEPMQCTRVSAQPTPGPTEQSLFPTVGEEDWVIGPEDATLTLIEYSDFQ